MEKTITTTVYECDNCEKEEPPFLDPKGLEELPTGWFRFRLSVELKAAPRRQVSSGGGAHRCACSAECIEAIVAADLEDLEAKRLKALNIQKAEDEAEAKKTEGE